MSSGGWISEEEDADLRAIVVALERAQYAYAADLYDLNRTLQRDAAASLLRAEVALNQDDAARALAILLKLRAEKRELEVRRNILLGAAYTHNFQYDVADEHFEAARAAAGSDRDLAAQTAYRQGRRFVATDQPELARQFLQAARDGSSKRSQLEALQLESHVLEAEENYRDQARILMLLLEQIDLLQNEFVDIAAYGVWALSALACELFLPGAVELCELHLQAEWPPDLRIQRFQAFKSVAWAKALSGDYFNAFRYLRRSEQNAPTKTWHVIALLDRACVARCVKEQRWSRQDLAEAEDLAERVDWRTAAKEERVALLLLAELLAPIDPARASHYFTLYQEILESAPPAHSSKNPRARALVAYVEGVVHSACGHSRAASSAFERALNTYEKIQYAWRAGRCALRLYELTHENRFKDLAQTRLQYYASSCLADELRETIKRESRVHLPPMQRRVLEEIQAGHDTAEIARRLGRSSHTVKNHIKMIFKAYKVSSRPALLAAVAREQ
ncbi:MAG: hypothetical protein JO165_04880 [Candidatus Eremiobacteraeota bacterium]|nr:hypothetical protein [Candidatus Eremiobacteraeota bacterium]